MKPMSSIRRISNGVLKGEEKLKKNKKNKTT